MLALMKLSRHHKNAYINAFLIYPAVDNVVEEVPSLQNGKEEEHVRFDIILFQEVIFISYSNSNKKRYATSIPKFLK